MVYVELPDVGKVVKQGETFGVVESVKVRLGVLSDAVNCVPPQERLTAAYSMLSMLRLGARLPAMCTRRSPVRLWR